MYFILRWQLLWLQLDQWQLLWLQLDQWKLLWLQLDRWQLSRFQLDRLYCLPKTPRMKSTIFMECG